MNFSLFSAPSPAPAEPEPIPQPPVEHSGSFIGPAVRLVGALRSEHELTVQGRIEGPVVGNGQVLVERGGVVEGDIRAAAIRVCGRTRGALVGTTQIVLEATADHGGSLQTPSLAVDAGATVDGEVKVGPGAETAAADPILRPSA